MYSWYFINNVYLLYRESLSCSSKVNDDWCTIVNGSGNLHRNVFSPEIDISIICINNSFRTPYFSPLKLEFVKYTIAFCATKKCFGSVSSTKAWRSSLVLLLWSTSSEPTHEVCLAVYTANTFSCFSWSLLKTAFIISSKIKWGENFI